jgi:Ca-activated chloride channel family protein
MKRFTAAVGGMVAALMLFAGANTTAGAFTPHCPEVRLDGKLNCPWVSKEGGLVYLQLAVSAHEIARRGRLPMNLAVVIDRSGSMGSEGKIENVKAAVRGLIDQLRQDDILSIVIYDDVVDVLRPAGRVEDKSILRRLVDEISPRGWTNLGGGMMEGFHQVDLHSGRGYVNRVILLTDGLANRGITSQEELGRIARRYCSRSVSLSTIGVGLEYNENLLITLANSGGGNYYYLYHPRELARIFQREFDLLSTLVAQNSCVDVILGRGIHLKDAIGCELAHEGDRLMVALGDLAAGECREVTLALDLPPGIGTRAIAEAVVRYATEGHADRRSNSIRVLVTYTGDAASIDKHRDWDIQAKADVALSTRKVEQALLALDAGRKDEALNVLNDARQTIASSPAAAQSGAAGVIVKEQSSRIRGFEEKIGSGGEDAAKVKKLIQYENYRIQRQR